MKEPAFKQVQRQFAAYIRHPDVQAPPGHIEPRRLKVYSDLFYNNVESFIRSGFPVLHTVLTETRWHDLVREFFNRHACLSPYFVEIPGEFLSFLLNTYQPLPEDPPFLIELAHYEWMELVLDVAEEEIPDNGFNPEGDLLEAVPFVSPLVCVLSYSYPVHQICESFQPDAPLQQPVWLVVYRDQGYSVRFMEINAMTARLLELLESHPAYTGKDVLTLLANESGHALPQSQFLEFGAETLAKLQTAGIILGARLEITG